MLSSRYACKLLGGVLLRKRKSCEQVVAACGAEGEELLENGEDNGTGVTEIGRERALRGSALLGTAPAAPAQFLPLNSQRRLL